MKRIEEKAWAVVDETIYKKDGHIFCMVWLPHVERFSQAIFAHESYAHDFADRMAKMGKQLVVPVTITYEMPEPRSKKKRNVPKSL